MSNEEGNRTRMTQIKRINTDQISEDQSNPRHQRSIPKNWSWVKLGDVCEILDNKRSPINSDERDKRISGKSIESLFPYYGATGQVGYIDDYLLEGEFVLLGEDGAPFLEKHKPKAYIVNGKIWVNNHAHILLSKNHNKFLCYYLNFLDYHPFVTGTTRLKLNQSAMKQIPIVNPPLPEQKKIVEKIEELFSGLDSGVASLKKAKEQIRLYKQSVLVSAFNGKLSGKGNIDENTGLPESWKLLPLKNIVVSDRGGLKRGPFGSSIKKSFFVESGYKVYEQGNAINDDPYRGKYYINEEKYKELESFKVIPGDLIVSCSGVTLGRITEIPIDALQGIINQALLRIRLNKKIISNKYFVIMFRSHFFQKRIFLESQGTAMPNLVGLKYLKEINIVIPPLSQQTQIVEEIEKRFSEADNLEKAIDESLAKSETLRQSILKKAFEGKLV